MPTTQNEQTYLKKLINVVVNKAREYYKEKGEKIPNVNDWLQFAIANGKKDYRIWERTQDEVNKQIDADTKLTDEYKTLETERKASAEYKAESDAKKMAQLTKRETIANFNKAMENNPQRARVLYSLAFLSLEKKLSISFSVSNVLWSAPLSTASSFALL